MLTATEFFTRLPEVASLFNGRHGWMLYSLVKWLQPESVVETGTYAGGTAAYLARAIQENGQGLLTCIDDFSLDGRAYEHLWYNLGRLDLGDVVQVHVGKSTDPDLWPDKVDMAFVDGDHSYQGCSNDCAQAEQRGAYCLILHDVQSWWGPREWLEKARQNPESGWDILQAPFDQGLAIALKRCNLGEVYFTKDSYPSGEAKYETPA